MRVQRKERFMARNNSGTKIPQTVSAQPRLLVQRIPAKSVFEKGQDPGHLLRPGMSVEPHVKLW